MHINKIIGILLQLLQEEAKIKDENITEYLNISTDKYYQILKGEKGLDMKLLRKISDLYGLNDNIIPECVRTIKNTLQLTNNPKDYENLDLTTISALNQTTKYLKQVHGLNTDNGFMEIK